MQPINAKRASVDMSLCEVSLQEAFIELKKLVTVATLRVAPEQVFYAKQLLGQISARVAGNPLAPQINLEVEHQYRPTEWSLTIDGKTWWTGGA